MVWTLFDVYITASLAIAAEPSNIDALPIIAASCVLNFG
jgi:hypothetical protein